MATSFFTSAVTNQVYCYHYRQEGYDPEKNPDVMEPEYRTRQEIAEGAGVESIVMNGPSVVKISPNPATEYFKINVNSEVKCVKIYSLGGQLVKTVTYPENNIVKVNGLSAGLYLLSIDTNEGNQISKLIVK